MLAVWLAFIVVLALLGTGVESRLVQSVFILPGTETGRAYDLAAQEFGDSVIIPVLLEGPEAAIDEQGPELVAELSARDDVRVLSPWDRGAGVERLRPTPRAAMILATYDIPLEEAFDTLAPEVRSTVDGTISEPVEARVTGMPIIGNDVKQETYDSVDRAELIALPILAIVLLLVFRAPVAALIPALTGLSTLFASSGVIWLAAGAFDVDPVAVALASMMGLALGVDYSLLIVSRFREEVRGGLAAPDAVVRSMATAGRTVMFAGLALLVAMLVALLVVPGSLLLSAAVGVIASTLLSMIAAFVAMPAALALIGERIDVWHLGRRRDGTPAWLALVAAALRRPGLTAVAILVPLLVFAVPAMALDTGPPDVDQLPDDSRARTDYNRVRDVMGPGWAAPFEVMVVADEGPITEPKRLRRIRSFQRDVNREQEVLNVVGPGRLVKQSQRAVRSERALRRGRRGLGRLRRGLRQAEVGLASVASGLGDAAGAAARLGGAGSEAAAGAATLSERLDQAAAGSTMISDALGGAEQGTEQLADGLSQALDAYRKLVPEVGFLKDKVSLELRNGARAIAGSLRNSVENLDDLTERSEVITDDVAEALRQVEAMGVGRSDPAYPALRRAILDAYVQVTGRNLLNGQQIDPDYRGLTGQLEFISISVNTEVKNARRLVGASRDLADGIGELKQGLTRLRFGTRDLLEGADQLADGVARGEGVVAELATGLGRLSDGAAELESGLGILAGGGRELASGLSSAGVQVRPLVDGLAEARRGTGRLIRGSRRGIGRTLKRSPGIFESGYFVLAAIDGTDEEDRERAEVAVNASKGGEAARVVVVPRSAPNSEATADLRNDLSERADVLGTDLGAEAEVGGTAAALVEYDEATSASLPLLIVALAVASYFVLIPIFRSLLLPAIAVLLNLLSVAVAFGALAVLFQGSDPTLGGPGYVDAVVISAIYTVVFGLSLDYQVFLITRMREGWLRHDDPTEAITFGLDRTAAVVTGAAAIMTAVFLSFALSDITNTRQFGVGLAIAVLIDATIVRLFLLPAVMRLFGREVWAFPRWLDRALPKVDA